VDTFANFYISTSLLNDSLVLLIHMLKGVGVGKDSFNEKEVKRSLE
jgi:hypothetical protein